MENQGELTKQLARTSTNRRNQTERMDNKMTHNRFTWTKVKVALLVIIVGLLPISTFAQVAKYGEVTDSGKYESYISQDGTHYKPGDKLKLGVPQGGNQTFTYVTEHVGGTLFGSSAPCSANCVGLEYEIVSFRAGGEGQGFRMWSKMQPAGGSGAPITVQFENALQSGELIGRGYTSDQALQELKRWKDKLDLELITKDEYELKKQELSKYIH